MKIKLSIKSFMCFRFRVILITQENQKIILDSFYLYLLKALLIFVSELALESNYLLS